MAKQYVRREQRLEQIAKAALEVIAEDGLRGFTTKAIAERVGITDGTIFRHFKSKAEIVIAAMDRLESQMFAGGFPVDKDPFDRLEAFFVKRATILGGPDPVGRLMFSEQLVHAAGEAGLAKLNNWRKKNVTFVVGCMGELAEQGRLREGLSPSQAARIFQGALLIFAFERVVSSTEVDDIKNAMAGNLAALKVALIQSNS